MKMSISTISVLMLLRSMDECGSARYTKWQLSDGFTVTDYDRNITLMFSNDKLNISWLQLVNYAGNGNLDWEILYELMLISDVCLTKLSAELFDVGDTNIIKDMSFSSSCYIHRIWDEIDLLYDYHYYTDNGDDLTKIAIPSRKVSINSKQYSIYGAALSEFARANYISNSLYDRLDNWWDMKEYNLPDAIHVLDSVSRYLTEHFPQFESKSIQGDGHYELLLGNVSFKILDDVIDDVQVIGTLDLAYLDNPLLIKELFKSNITFFLYLVHAITVTYSIERNIS